MRTLPQDLAKLVVSNPSSKAKTAAPSDFSEAVWTAVGFVVLLLMLAFLALVTQVSPRPDQTEKPPVKSKTTNQSIAEVRI